ncbi:zinc finger protein 91-like [Malaya genurostris]|uniref:zinc finger protein 91-like n=1 Tax=Malaya genurostris TaxID=325434 RepID=UPI0026F3A5FC|nr:zinc finger protein 91-like [Malaya genurostris]
MSSEFSGNSITNITPTADYTFDDCADPEPSDLICVLCLRQCTSEQCVQFSTSENDTFFDAFENRSKLENLLNIDLDLKHFVTCLTCWKLVEMFIDFKQCCLKAEQWSHKFINGLSRHQKDNEFWLCHEMFALIDRTHQEIREHFDRMNAEEITPKDVSSLMPMESICIKLDIVEESPPVGNEDTQSKKRPRKNRIVKDALHEDVENPDSLIVEKSDIDVTACEKCDRKFDTEIGHRLHIQHCKGRETGKLEKSYVECSICTASFKDPTSLNYHMNKHKGVKPYKCRQKCDKYFYSAFSRKHHETNCGSDTHVCPHCGALLKNADTLGNHITHVHGEATIGCETCGKMFKSKKKLSRHMLVHTNIRNYPCTVCEKAFKSSYAANVHRRIHTQEKPFICEICGQDFTYKCSLKAHVSRDHGWQAD